MSNTLDQRNSSYQQSAQGAFALVIGMFLVDFGGAIYAAGSDTETYQVTVQGWKLELKREPNLRVVIRTEEPRLLNMVRDVLRTLGYTVNSMREPVGQVNYLVALV
jgi:hypothetical protein